MAIQEMHLHHQTTSRPELTLRRADISPAARIAILAMNARPSSHRARQNAQIVGIKSAPSVLVSRL
jgi:hypothetical protein